MSDGVYQGPIYESVVARLRFMFSEFEHEAAEEENN